jgi:hypothetical protein
MNALQVFPNLIGVIGLGGLVAKVAASPVTPRPQLTATDSRHSP